MHSSSVPLVFASSAGIILSRTCSSTSFRYRIFSSSMPSSCVHYAFPTLRLRWSSLARSLPACSRCALLLWFTSVPSSLFKQCHFSGHQHCLFAALDETFMTFHISMLSVMLSPMQCVPHPNGQATVRSALTVVCGALAHTTRLTISAGALFIPLSFQSIYLSLDRLAIPCPCAPVRHAVSPQLGFLARTIPVGGSLVLSSTFIPKCSYRRGAVFTHRCQDRSFSYLCVACVNGSYEKGRPMAELCGQLLRCGSKCGNAGDYRDWCFVC